MAETETDARKGDYACVAGSLRHSPHFQSSWLITSVHKDQRDLEADRGSSLL